MASETPKCERCGRTIPARRRVTSDYCTNGCAKQQAWDDEESARIEHEEVERMLAHPQQGGGDGK